VDGGLAKKKEKNLVHKGENCTMKYAQLVKLGGDLVEAKDADYEDYFGFLVCPECREPVFLRKSHQRTVKNQQIPTTVPAAFIHHRATDEVQTCEQRIARYTVEKIESFGGQARQQRIAKLQVSMWKYLKQNHCVNLNAYSKLKPDFSKSPMLRELLRFSLSIVAANPELIVKTTLPQVSSLLLAKDERIGMSPVMKEQVETFLERRKRNWAVHQRCSAEALELLLTSTYLAETREKLIQVICHPLSLEFHDPELLDSDCSSGEWRITYASYLSLILPLTFLTVDWLTVFQFLPPTNPFTKNAVKR